MDTENVCRICGIAYNAGSRTCKEDICLEIVFKEHPHLKSKKRKVAKLNAYLNKRVYAEQILTIEMLEKRANSMNKRASDEGVVGEVTAIELMEVYLACGKSCNYCGTKKRLQFDHIKSYFWGGENTKTNLQVLCLRCNIIKGV